MSLPDWTLAEWLTIVGFPGVAIGLVLAWRQIKDTEAASTAAKVGAHAAQTAAEQAREAALAARAAVRDTQHKLANQNVLLMIAQVQRLADDLERDVNEQDALRLASEWVGAAGELHGMLLAAKDLLGAPGEHLVDPYEKLIALLQQSILVAGTCKNALVAPLAPTTTAAAILPLRRELTDIRAASSPILGWMRTYTGETPNA
jgi:hypothetical protein